MWVVCGCECVCVCVCAGGVCYVVYIGWRQCQFHVSAGYSPWKQACLRACQQRRTWKVLLRSFSSYETSCRVFRHRTRTLCKLIGPHSHRSIYGGGGGGGGGSHNHTGGGGGVTTTGLSIGGVTTTGLSTGGVTTTLCSLNSV